MKEIVERLIENHQRIQEDRKSVAIDKLVSNLKDKYPECDVSYNRYHNCVDVEYNGDIQFQAYLDRVPEEDTTYRYELVDDRSKLDPEEKIYRRVKKKGTRYNYDSDHITLKSIAKVTNT